jgi:DNA-binding PadR family transcriptional regulator
MREVFKFIRGVHDHDEVHPAFGPWQVPFGPRGPFGPGPFGWHVHGPFARGRARRGDVRVAILALLAERPMHGYEMIQELSARTGGMWRPSPGSVYPTLQLLEDEGLISSQETEGKRLFSLTDSGREEAERQPAGQAPWEQVTAGVDQSTVRMRDAVAQAAAAVMQVLHAGTDEQKAKALEVLTETRRKLYSILAEDDEPAES